MTVGFLILLTSFLATAFAGGLACWLYVNRREALPYLSLALLSGLVSLVHAANGYGFLDDEHALLWRRLALAMELCLPAALLYAGLRFLPQPGHPEWHVRLIGLLGLLLAGVTMTDHILVLIPLQGGGTAIMLGPWGPVPYVFVVIAMAIGIAQVEAVLRSSNELTRYRLNSS